MLLSKVGRTGVTLRGVCKPFFGAIIALAALIVALSLSVPAEAKPRFSAVAVDARTGQVLFAQGADGLRHPASLTKVMTLYLLFQDLEAGKVKLETLLRVSTRAAGMAPSKLGLKPGSAISVENAIKALVTKSANDVAAAIGENLGGSESAFAARMTKTAKALGMSKTVFRNASGLPDPAQVTTARDMATLGLRIQRDFPQYYPYFRIGSFVYNGRTIRNHNRLLGRYAGTDGIKTGYIRDAGFNLTTSARRGDRRVVGVVMGASSGKARNAFMMKMLDGAFPKCKSGTTIAALAGSSRGATERFAAASPPPVRKPVARPEGKSGVAGAFEMQSQMEQLALSAAESVTQAGDSSESADATSEVIAVPPAPAKPEVLEARLGEPALPAKLPFEVKTEAKHAPPRAKTAPRPDSTWRIQIGTYPTKKAAQVKLKNVLAASGSQLLKNKRAFTVTVQKGNKTIYRALLSGFSEKTAKGACRRLSKQKVDCLALPPQS